MYNSMYMYYSLLLVIKVYIPPSCMINGISFPPIAYLYTQLHASDPTLGVTYSTLVE